MITKEQQEISDWFSKKADPLHAPSVSSGIRWEYLKGRWLFTVVDKQWKKKWDEWEKRSFEFQIKWWKKWEERQLNEAKENPLCSQVPAQVSTVKTPKARKKPAKPPRSRAATVAGRVFLFAGLLFSVLTAFTER